MLSALLVHDGVPLRYGELEVEHLGTLYEGLIAFDLEIAEGESMALLPSHFVVDLEALLALPGRDRLARLEEVADLKLGARPAARVAAADSVAELSQALARRASPRHPDRIARGALYLQPGRLRRRAGSYYTPQEITSHVVERTLSPLLDREGPAGGARGCPRARRVRSRDGVRRVPGGGHAASSPRASSRRGRAPAMRRRSRAPSRRSRRSRARWRSWRSAVCTASTSTRSRSTSPGYRCGSSCRTRASR